MVTKEKLKVPGFAKPHRFVQDLGHLLGKSVAFHGVGYPTGTFNGLTKNLPETMDFPMMYGIFLYFFLLNQSIGICLTIPL